MPLPEKNICLLNARRWKNAFRVSLVVGHTNYLQYPKLELGVRVGAAFGLAHKDASIIKTENFAQSKLRKM